MDSYSKAALSKQTQGLTRLAFTQVDPGRPNGVPYLHLVKVNYLFIRQILKNKTYKIQITFYLVQFQKKKNTGLSALPPTRYFM